MKQFDGKITKDVLERLFAAADVTPEDAVHTAHCKVAKMLGVSPTAVTYWRDRVDSNPTYSQSSIPAIAAVLNNPKFANLAPVTFAPSMSREKRTMTPARLEALRNAVRTLTGSDTDDSVAVALKVHPHTVGDWERKAQGDRPTVLQAETNSRVDDVLEKAAIKRAVVPESRIVYLDTMMQVAMSPKFWAERTPEQRAKVLAAVKKGEAQAQTYRRIADLERELQQLKARL